MNTTPKLASTAGEIRAFFADLADDAPALDALAKLLMRVRVYIALNDSEEPDTYGWSVDAEACWLTHDGPEEDGGEDEVRQYREGQDRPDYAAPALVLTAELPRSWQRGSRPCGTLDGE